MSIAIIGWGSLVWNPDTLKIQFNHWYSNGPRLPIEFSRISKDNRVSLVIDPTSERIQTLWAFSSFYTIAEARENLSQREGTTLKNIRFIDLLTGQTSDMSKDEYHWVSEWADGKQLEGIIWTGLQRNFESKFEQLHGRRPTLSVDGILDHLGRLDFKSFGVARNYILRTHPQIQTPFRPALEEEIKKLIPKSVLIHEAGHILIARAYGWEISDIKVKHDAKDEALFSVEYTKNVDGTICPGYFPRPVNEAQTTTNVERIVATQGGWAADTINQLSDNGQYECDNKNFEVILSTLTNFSLTKENVRQRALSIVSTNESALLLITKDLKEYFLTNNPKIFTTDYKLKV
jgi:hypothetical protein